MVDPILRNVKPPVFLSLKIHRLKFGSRSPEVVSMQTFSVSRRRVVLHARVRFVGDDLQAVLVGGMLTGRVFAGAPPPPAPPLACCPRRRKHHVYTPNCLPPSRPRACLAARLLASNVIGRALTSPELGRAECSIRQGGGC